MMNSGPVYDLSSILLVMSEKNNLTSYDCFELFFNFFNELLIAVQFASAFICFMYLLLPDYLDIL